MKHFTLWKSFLLLCALVVGSNVWATEDAEITTFSQISGDIDSYISYEALQGDGTTAPAISSNWLRIYKPSSGKSTGGYVSISANSGSKINSITITNANDKAGTIKYNVDGGELSSGVSFAKSATYTVNNINATTISFYNCGSDRLSIAGISVTYTAPTKTNPTISFSNGTVRVGKMLDLSTLFESNSEGAVTYSITAGNSYASVSGNILTGLAVGSVTVKAEQASAGTYNAGEASATITVQEALTLNSIAITTAPAKTTYTEGEIFDATGMVVTATYSDASTDDVTASCTWMPSGALSPSDDKVTVSYTENATTKTAEQAIIVNVYVQPTTINMSLNNSFFGTSYSGANAKGSGSHQGSADNITVDFISGGDKNNFYISDTEIRAYSGNTLKFTAPSKYLITKIEFTNAWATGTTVDDGTLSKDRKTWSNSDGSEKVSFTPTSRSDMTSLAITLAPTASISANKEWITYTSKHALDFSSDITGLEGAYTITSHSAGATTLTATKMTGTVKAGTGLLLHAAAVDTENAQVIAIPVAASGDEQTDNMLVGVTSATTVNPTDGTKTNLGLKSGSFVPYSAAGTLAAGKAYLQIPTADMPSNGSKLTIIFDDDETTEINNIEEQGARNKEHEGTYNLAGQKVSESYKGIVIVNGKKYIRK